MSCITDREKRNENYNDHKSYIIQAKKTVDFEENRIYCIYAESRYKVKL